MVFLAKVSYLFLSRKRQIHCPRVISTDVRAGVGRGCKEWLPITGGIARREIWRGRFASFREGDKDRARTRSRYLFLLTVSREYLSPSRYPRLSPLCFPKQNFPARNSISKNSSISSTSPSYNNNNNNNNKYRNQRQFLILKITFISRPSNVANNFSLSSVLIRRNERPSWRPTDSLRANKSRGKIGRKIGFGSLLSPRFSPSCLLSSLESKENGATKKELARTERQAPA